MPELIAEQLKKAIVASGLSLYSLAKQAETTPEQIGRFLKGERDMRMETASRIAAVLGLELTPIDPQSP